MPPPQDLQRAHLARPPFPNSRDLGELICVQEKKNETKEKKNSKLFIVSVYIYIYIFSLKTERRLVPLICHAFLNAPFPGIT